MCANSNLIKDAGKDLGKFASKNWKTALGIGMPGMIPGLTPWHNQGGK